MATVEELISEDYIDITPEELMKLQNTEWIGQMRSEQESMYHLIFIHDGKKYRVTKRLKNPPPPFTEKLDDEELEETEKKPFGYTINILEGQVKNLENTIRKFEKRKPIAAENIARKERILGALAKKIIEVKSVIELLQKQDS
jgi:hypothetical protein